MLLAVLILFGTAGLLGVLRAAGTAWLLLIAAAALAAVTGALAVAGHVQRLGLGGWAGLGPLALRADRLSGLFLVICFAIATPVLLAASNSAGRNRPRLPAAIAMTLAAVLVVLTTDHLFALLFGWEALTFAFYLLSGYDRTLPGRGTASITAGMFGKVSGACLLAGGLLLAAQSHGFLLADLGSGPHQTGWQVGYGLLLLGFAIKVGLVPLQAWLPPAYAAAPGPARAIMAGVTVNVGFYGMWRTLQMLGPAPVWLAAAVLVLAGITAILGIAHCAVHADLAYFVAWSSVENAGVISAGFGAALVGSAAHNPRLQAAGLLAATAQVIAHALGKSLLFTATNAVEADTGTTDLDALRGVARAMPYSGTGLVVGALTLAGLPLTAGFAAEWLTLEALMQQFRVSDLATQLGSAVAGALVALTVGVAGVAFVRLIALTAFGTPAIRPARIVAERAGGHRIAISALSLACLAVAAVAPLEVRLIAAGLEPVSGTATRGALAAPWVLQPVFAQFSALSPSWLWVVLPGLAGVVVVVATALSRGGFWHVRRVPAWHSAAPGADTGYTSYAWANPMRTVLANVLLARGLSRPLGRGVLLLVAGAKRLQSGRLDAYLAYLLIALVAALAVVTALA